MSVYRRMKDGKPYGPWIIQYPHRMDPITGRTIYTTKTVGSSKRLAKRLLAEKQNEWEKRKMLGQTSALSNPTLNEIIQWYLEQPVSKANKTHKKERERFKHIKPRMGKLKLSQIKQNSVLAFQQEMLKTKSNAGRNFAPATVNHMVKLIRKSCNLAIKAGLIAHNPISGIAMIKENNEIGRTLSIREFNQLEKHLSAYLLPISRLAFFTGMRKGEILNLTWGMLDESPGYISLRSSQTKSQNARMVPLGSDLRKMLEDLRPSTCTPDSRVFLKKGKPIRDVYWDFVSSVKKSGLGHLRFHDLRHSFVTNARRAGIERKVIKAISGHSSDSSFDRYSHVETTDITGAVNKLEEFLVEHG